MRSVYIARRNNSKTNKKTSKSQPALIPKKTEINPILHHLYSYKRTLLSITLILILIHDENFNPLGYLHDHEILWEIQNVCKINFQKICWIKASFLLAWINKHIIIHWENKQLYGDFFLQKLGNDNTKHRFKLMSVLLISL